ncbi:MAG: EAL domain-containing protein [Burkholderiaceae bacterium]
MQQALHERSSLEADLRQGLQRGEFHVHPPGRRRPQGATSRAPKPWRAGTTQRGAIPPIEFIPLAEQTGLILPLGQHILHTACQQLVRWALTPETAHLSVAVNVSARQFRQPDFCRAGAAHPAARPAPTEGA